MNCECERDNEGILVLSQECPEHRDYALVRERLDLCECLDASVYELLRELLAVAPFHSNQERLHELLPDRATRQLLLNMLSSRELDLLSHGGNVDGSWLTTYGEYVRDLLATWPNMA